MHDSQFLLQGSAREDNFVVMDQLFDLGVVQRHQLRTGDNNSSHGVFMIALRVILLNGVPGQFRIEIRNIVYGLWIGDDTGLGSDGDRCERVVT